jgi:RNA-directed DNA polymerase
MVHAQPGQRHRADKSRQRQRRLYRAAKRSRNRRFPALYDRIARPAMLWRAGQEVRANGGSAGVDGLGIEEVECQGVDGFLQAMADDLQGGSSQPQPVLRVDIPTPDGRQRPLGLPPGRDRVVQQACTLVIEPRFEANFQDHSDGFRPKRSAAQAVVSNWATAISVSPTVAALRSRRRRPWLGASMPCASVAWRRGR